MSRYQRLVLIILALILVSVIALTATVFFSDRERTLAPSDATAAYFSGIVQTYGLTHGPPILEYELTRAAQR